MRKKITKEEVLRLWKDPNFSGSYRGLKTFQISLKLQKNVDVSEKKLFNILKTEPIYLIHQKAHRKFERRHLDLNNYGELVFGDIGKLIELSAY
jgi:hypothetical protein